MSDIQFRFTYYEPWMREQVIDLFCREYKTEKDVFSSYFDKFYFNKDHQPEAIKIVALEEQKVAGFVSFISWPYVIEKKAMKSVQCGNVIVNENYRGKGLYNKMLKHFDEIAINHNIDFAIGFPIKPILGLYLKSNWTNLLNLQWFIKPVNPFAAFKKFNNHSFTKHFIQKRTFTEQNIPFNNIYLNQTREFIEWRDDYKPFLIQKEVYFFYYESMGNHIQFELKINERSKIRELMIGDVKTNSLDKDFIRKALKKLYFKAILSGQITMLSIAINEQSKEELMLKTLKSAWFVKIKKDISFIIKNFKGPIEIESPENWSLFRSDLDTW